MPVSRRANNTSPLASRSRKKNKRREDKKKTKFAVANARSLENKMQSVYSLFDDEEVDFMIILSERKKPNPALIS